MRPTISQYAQSLEELTTGKTSVQVLEIAKNFTLFLKRRGEGEKMKDIVKCLEQSEQKTSGHLTVTAVTAKEPTKEIKTLLSHQAEKLFPQKKITLEYIVDEGVIGGALFRTSEALYDATLSTELKSLKKFLLKA